MTFDGSTLTDSLLTHSYSKLLTSLNFDHIPASDLTFGMTIIVTPKWMFISVLNSAYTTYRGMPVYPDGYAYAGLINMQEIEEEWPATAGIVNSKIRIMDVLASKFWMTFE
jgi:hypothetical protein